MPIYVYMCMSIISMYMYMYHILFTSEFVTKNDSNQNIFNNSNFDQILIKLVSSIFERKICILVILMKHNGINLTYLTYYCASINLFRTYCTLVAFSKLVDLKN